MDGNSNVNIIKLFAGIVIIAAGACIIEYFTGNRNINIASKIVPQHRHEYFDIFAGDGDSLITRQEHLGIVNGQVSTGIAHAQVGMIEGLWAAPYVSSDFVVDPRVFGERIATEHYVWLPFQTQTIGRVKGIEAKATVTLVHGMRGGVVKMELRNVGDMRRHIPVQLVMNTPRNYRATIDSTRQWEFLAPVSTTPAVDFVDSMGIRRVQGGMCIAVGSDLSGLYWEPVTRRFHGQLELAAGKSCSFYTVFAIGGVAQAQSERSMLLADPERHIHDAEDAYYAQVSNIFAHLPRFYSDNQRLEQLYNRSLSIFVTNRAEAPGQILQPHYATGAVRGGCTCNYLWDFGELNEILQVHDPAAARAHILQFLKCGCVDAHDAFNPLTGEPFGDWYAVNHEKITGHVYHYVKLTGDVDFLNTVVANGRTVLDLMVDCAMFGIDPGSDNMLIDYSVYGSENSHLELRRAGLGYEYSHVMPDLNGRRYKTFQKVSALCAQAGRPQPELMVYAEALKRQLIEELWMPAEGWFNFINSKGKKDVRWTIQMFKLFEGGLLDNDMKTKMLAHINSDEFLGPFGMHSISKKDAAFDQVDVDNGGGGSCPAFPVQIAEFLYKDGFVHEADAIVRRLLWWGSRLPYLGDSQLASEMDYRQDTPLQSSIQTATPAQCIIFGMMGVEVAMDGTITINPKPTGLCKAMELKGLKLRGRTLDISRKGNDFTVVVDGQKSHSTLGKQVVIPAGE